ncbi:phosphonate C-P lyase system protein PhnH [Haematobacter massiliensis]|uniref:phosphonate C-P lyase system protein PhnH n=1 Tax=Haematobacter massiliensis TaxID=195105 RepID=UPI003C6D0B5C
MDGSITISPALSPELWGIRAERVTYPLGFDLFIVDGDRVIGLPRSTHIEVL